jgi:hypothetical protein
MKSIDLYENSIGKEVYISLWHASDPTLFLGYKKGEIVDSPRGEQYTIMLEGRIFHDVSRERILFADDATEGDLAQIV